MPIYAFRCAACGHEFDRLQKLSDADPDTCPECGATGEVGRKLTAPSFRLAGSGWYETDFKKDGDRKRNLAEGGEGAGKADDASAARSDAKPDASPAAGKPETKPQAPAAGNGNGKPQAPAAGNGTPAAAGKGTPATGKPANG